MSDEFIQTLKVVRDCKSFDEWFKTHWRKLRSSRHVSRSGVAGPGYGGVPYPSFLRHLRR